MFDARIEVVASITSFADMDNLKGPLHQQSQIR